MKFMNVQGLLAVFALLMEEEGELILQLQSNVFINP